MNDEMALGSDFGIIGPGGFIVAKPIRRYALGLDLGQSIDPSAISIVEMVREPLPVGVDLIQRLAPPKYRCVHLERIPLQTSYPVQVQHVANLLNRAPLKGNVGFALDATGVGRPVTDLFRAAGLNPVAITITSGEKETRSPEGNGWHVAKIQLVSTLQSLLHSGDLLIAKSLPEAATLASELQNFRANISDSGNVGFGARVGKHDDLVLSLAISCWILKCGERNSFTTEPLENVVHW